MGKSKKPLYLSLIILLGLGGSYAFVPAVQDFFDEAWQVLTSNDEAQINTWVRGFGWYGPVVIVLAMVGQMFLIVIPTTLLMLAAILAYGPVWGSLLALASIIVASTVGYFIGKYIGPAFVDRLLGEKSKRKVSEFISEHGFWAIAITRLNPFLSDDALSFVAGILKMRYWKFMGATVTGVLPLIIFMAALGRNTGTLTKGLLWGSLFSFVLYVAFVWWKKRKGK